MTEESLFGEPIYKYTRAQALADGVLVNLSHFEAMRQHRKVPIACTAAVWVIIAEAAMRPGHDIEGICHDIAVLAKLGVPKQTDKQLVWFKIFLAGRDHTLKLHIGPGDHGEPVLTLMLPNED